MHSHRICFTVALLLVPAAARAQDDKVFKQLSIEQAEAILRVMKIDAKQTPGKNNVTYFDFQRQGVNVRFYLYGGKDIMLDAVFGGQTLAKINEWNVRAKFSRACLHKDDKGEFSTLEANLDILGGVTEGTIRQFILVFDEEIKAYSKFIGGSTAPAIDPNEPIYTKAAPAKIEGILTGLKIEFKKAEKGDVAAFDFEMANHKVRLTSFAGGADIMIDAHFKKTALATVNDYNLKRKFIRTVAYNLMGNEYTALETNLDCTGGISDSILRHFIRSFEDEVKSFSQFMQGK